MIEDLHTDDDLPIPAATGWSAMHALLNKEMPVKKIKKRSIVFVLIPIAAVMIILISVSIKLNHDYYSARFYQHTGYDNNAVDVMKTANNEISFKQNKKVTKHYKKPEEANYKKIALDQTISFDKIDNNASYSPARYIASPEINKIVSKKAFPISPIHIPVDAMKLPLKKWSIDAGAAVNIATVGNQNYQPYPFISFKYHLSKKLFVSSGLAILSPAPGTVSGVSKISPVNDVINNTSQYNEVTHYHQLKYADVPLTIGLQLSKQFSVQAGFQSSVLLNKQISKERIAYDFQMNRINISAVNTVYAPTAIPEQLFKVKMPAMDYRVLSGINYSVNKTTIGLFYQHSLRNKELSNNNLFSFQLSQQLK